MLPVISRYPSRLALLYLANCLTTPYSACHHLIPVPPSRLAQSVCEHSNISTCTYHPCWSSFLARKNIYASFHALQLVLLFAFHCWCARNTREKLLLFFVLSLSFSYTHRRDRKNKSA
uniref:Putative secreted peptide n=1 Tax=Anopheles braziliensis TaxID=58242 RepID=A0A2M3ZN09_9DIPT